MKTLPITLATDERLALRRFASERGISLEQATAVVLRDWLIGNGYLEMVYELDEDSGECLKASMRPILPQEQFTTCQVVACRIRSERDRSPGD